MSAGDLAAAVNRYDQAIRSCAADPAKMATFCTAEGEDLDALYFAMVNLARRPARAGLRIVFRPLLVSGMLGDADLGPVMLIDNEQPPLEQARAVWHETVHFLLLAAGQGKHDEKVIEAMALRLAGACPEIVTMLRPGHPGMPDDKGHAENPTHDTKKPGAAGAQPSSPPASK